MDRLSREAVADAWLATRDPGPEVQLGWDRIPVFRRGRGSVRAAADLNAVPPLGIEGIEVTDNAVEREGVTTFGALGVGGLKMKIHKACIARLFESNNLVLDAESIAEVARELR